MAFYEVQFPPQISYGAKGGPGFLTRVVSTAAGFEYRNQMFSKARGRWDVAHGLKTPADGQALIAFFRAMQGRTHGFRFKDWTDFQDWGLGSLQTNPDGFVQLAKLYSVASGPTAARFISKPVTGTVTLPGSVTLDYTTGLCTGGGAVPGAVWTGQFDVPARFDVDTMDVSIDEPYGVAGTMVSTSWQQVPIVELRS